MSIAYVNGHYMPLEQAFISVMDRGFLFGDGVYEVIPVFANRAFREKEHLKRLDKNLRAIYIEIESNIFKDIIQGLLEASPSSLEQAIYLQVTRGIASFRDHHIPSDISPTFFAYCMLMPNQKKDKAQGVVIITVDDIRWQRCDIKSLNLLPNILMQRKAEQMGADEAIFVRDGLALEGTSTNLFMVKDGVLYTPPLGKWLLSGITRELVLQLAHQESIVTCEHDIKESELNDSDEIWITSSTKEISPVIMLNNKKIGTGKAGPVWWQMHHAYQEYKRMLMS